MNSIGGSFGSAPSSVRLTPIYAPSLSLNAGAGGIKIDKSIILAPILYTDPVTGNTYSEGSLSIVTRDGGNLSGAVVSGSTVLNGITMSDSASGNYTTFASEHDNIHQFDPNPQPVYVDVSGSIGSFSLTVPTFANITVKARRHLSHRTEPAFLELTISVFRAAICPPARRLDQCSRHDYLSR